MTTVACANYEGQLTATKCKCGKNKVGCNFNCSCRACGNDFGKNLATEMWQSPSMKQAKRGLQILQDANLKFHGRKNRW